MKLFQSTKMRADFWLFIEYSLIDGRSPLDFAFMIESSLKREDIWTDRSSSAKIDIPSQCFFFQDACLGWVVRRVATKSWMRATHWIFSHKRPSLRQSSSLDPAAFIKSIPIRRSKEIGLARLRTDDWTATWRLRSKRLLFLAYFGWKTHTLFNKSPRSSS